MAELDVKQRQAGDVTILDMSGAVRMGDSKFHSPGNIIIVNKIY